MKASVVSKASAAAVLLFLCVGSPRASVGADVIVTTAQQFSVLDASDGAADGCLNVNGNLIIANGGSIECNDPSSPPNGNACPICIKVSGSMEIQAGGAIFAENRITGGSGGNITITVGGNLILRGTSGPLDGAVISSSKLSGAGDTGTAGNIEIAVTGNVKTETGSEVLANSPGQGGDILITATTIDIDGLVSSKGGTTVGQGGTIFLIASCTLTISDTGVVSSRGQDMGADLVHLEACIVEIDGLVESTGAGQGTNAPNRLNDGFRPDKPSNSTAGVEVWGGVRVTLNGVSPHNGEINADTGMSGGTNGIGWIDIFARGDISILNDSGGNYAVHANQTLGNGHGGLITVKSLAGKVATTGKAIQANDTAAGGQGGVVTVEAGGTAAGGNVEFDASSVQAKGSTGGGAKHAGGKIAVRSFNGCIEGAGGELNAAGGPPLGSVSLTACCATIGYSGVSVPVAAETTGVCGGAPSFAAYVVLPAPNCQVTCNPPPNDCPTCNGNTVVVDQNVTVDFNTDPPTYTGDPDLQSFFRFDRSGATPDTWRAIFDLGASKLLVKNGAVITVTDVPPGGSGRASPGIEITSTCEVEIEFGAAVVVDSMNRKAGPIIIHADGNVTINGLVSDTGQGTVGIPGEITISTCCGDIKTGPQSKVITSGTDVGGSDINLVACCPDGDIFIFGLVDVFYKGGPPGNINIAAFHGAVTIDGNTLQGIESGTGRRITSGVTVRQGGGQAPVAGNIKIQALNDITVLGNATLTTNNNQVNLGAVAVKPYATNGQGGNGDIIVVSLEGKIIARDRAFDFDVRFDDLNAITLLAKLDIELSVTASINAGAADNSKAVVSVRGGLNGKGGTNTLRSYSAGISIGAHAQVLATGPAGNGTNNLTSCTGVVNSGVVNPPDANLADDSGVCAPAAPEPLFMGCPDFDVTDCSNLCQ